MKPTIECPQCQADLLMQDEWASVRHLWLCGYSMKDAVKVWIHLYARFSRRLRNIAASVIAVSSLAGALRECF